MDENALREQIKGLFQKQQMCLGFQKLLIVLTIVFYKHAVILLPVHIAIVVIWGGILSNQATSLARKKPRMFFRAQTILEKEPAGTRISWKKLRVSMIV